MTYLTISANIFGRYNAVLTNISRNFLYHFQKNGDISFVVSRLFTFSISLSRSFPFIFTVKYGKMLCSLIFFSLSRSLICDCMIACVAFETASLFNDSIYIIFLFNFRLASDKVDSHSHHIFLCLSLSVGSC